MIPRCSILYLHSTASSKSFSSCCFSQQLTYVWKISIFLNLSLKYWRLRSAHQFTLPLREWKRQNWKQFSETVYFAGRLNSQLLDKNGYLKNRNRNCQAALSVCALGCLRGDRHWAPASLASYWLVATACPAYRHASSLPRVCVIVNGPHCELYPHGSTG